VKIERIESALVSKKKPQKLKQQTFELINTASNEKLLRYPFCAISSNNWL